jgi:hypothetical protein
MKTLTFPKLTCAFECELGITCEGLLMNFGLSGFYNGIVPNYVFRTLLFLCFVRPSTAHAGDDASVVALANGGGELLGCPAQFFSSARCLRCART